MNTRSAEGIFSHWFRASDDELIEALDLTVSPSWLENYPDLMIHPRDTINEKTLGVHQSWDCNLMPYRELMFRGQRIFLFEHHIDLILKNYI